MAQIRIVDDWLRSPTSGPSHYRSVMVIAERWAEQRVLMRAYAESRDPRRPTIFLHGTELAIGPAGLDLQGPWGIHVGDNPEVRAPFIKEQLETSARRLAGSKGNSSPVGGAVHAGADAGHGSRVPSARPDLLPPVVQHVVAPEAVRVSPAPAAYVPSGGPGYSGAAAGYVPSGGPRYGGAAAGHVPSGPGYGGAAAGDVPSGPGYGGAAAGHVPSDPRYGGAAAGHVPSGPGYGGAAAGHVPSGPGYGGAAAGHVPSGPGHGGAAAGSVPSEGKTAPLPRAAQPAAPVRTALGYTSGSGAQSAITRLGLRPHISARLGRLVDRVVPDDFHIDARERRVLNALGDGPLTAHGVAQVLDLAEPAAFMDALTLKLERHHLDLVEFDAPQGREPTYRLRC